MIKVLKVFLFVFAALASFAAKPINADVKEYELTDHPILTFDNPQSKYHIKIRGTKLTCYTLIDSKKINVSYVVEIDLPLSSQAGTVYLSLQDRDGFEITKKSLNRVVADYQGSLKGNFSLEPKEYQNIAAAELFFYVDA